MKMRRWIIGLFFVIVVAGSCLGGWERTYGGPTEWLWAKDMELCEDGSFILCGFIGYGIHESNGYVSKVDSSGVELWTYETDEDGEERFYSISKSNYDGYVLTGYSDSQAIVVRINDFGDTLWTLKYGDAGWDCNYSITTSIDLGEREGFIATGVTEVASLRYDLTISLIDDSGLLSWRKIYGGYFHDIGYRIIENSEGGLLVAGITDSWGAGERDFYLLKTDITGDTVWTETYGGDNDDYFDGHNPEGKGGICEITDPYPGCPPGYLLVGQTESFGYTNGAFYIVRTNLDGDTLWTRIFIHPDHSTTEQFATDVICVNDTGFQTDFAVVGAVEIDRLTWLITISDTLEGDTIGTKEFITYPIQYPCCIVKCPNGGYAIGGTAEEDYERKFWIVRFDSLGYTGIKENSPSAKPEAFAISAHPNPFNSAVSISAPEGAEVEVFDLNGRRVAQLPDGGTVGVGLKPARAGGSETLPYGSVYLWTPDKSLGSGVYLVRARVGDKEAMKRVVYLK